MRRHGELHVNRWSRQRKNRGFTLLEMLVTMVIIGVMTAVSFRFIAGSMEAYADAEQRFGIIEAADPALSRLTNDIAQSLPYSIRITPDGRAIEFALVVEGGFYRQQAPLPPNFQGPPLRPLQFSPNVMLSGAANSFSLLGLLKVVTSGRVAQANGLYANLLGPGAEGYAVSVGHFGDLDAAGRPLDGFNIYAAATVEPVSGEAMHVVSPAGVQLMDVITRQMPGGDQVTSADITLPANHVFPTQSTSRRLHVINGFVSYICNGDKLYRRQLGVTTGRTLQQNIAIPVNTPVLANGLSSCRFEQDRGSLFQAPMVAIELRLAHPHDNGELVVFRQARVKAEP